MPTVGKRWRHIIVNTRSSWLHGSERGFRTRGHRIHSSGDYKNPPPLQEHEGLRRYHRERSQEPVTIPVAVRAAAGLAFLKKLRKEGCRVLAIAVADRHIHALVEMANSRVAIRQLVGWSKRCATEAMRPTLSGQVWAEGGEFKLVNDKSHQENVYLYILLDQGDDAWTWSYRDELGVPRFKGLEEKLKRRARKRSGAPRKLNRSGPERSSGLGVDG